MAVPVVDVAPLVRGDDASAVARAIDAACRETGFFTIVGHGVAPSLPDQVDRLAREFFALDADEKARISMARGGRAWRGWFPDGAELTGGVPDRKEGLYFGAELGPAHRRVRAGVPLHGPNLFPARPAALRDAVLRYVDQLTALGHAVLRGVAVALGRDAEWFRTGVTANPTVLFRIFRYPAVAPDHAGWGVAEHTDYGLLTILRQDDAGGLEVRGPRGWVEVPPRPDAFVCNIGDVLERLSGGAYRSTPHRVRNTSGAERISLALFVDPSWDAHVPGTDGTYGDYLTAKVSRVFPALWREVTS